MSLSVRLAAVTVLSLVSVSDALAGGCASALVPFTKVANASAHLSSNQSDGILSGSQAVTLWNDGTWLVTSYSGDWMFSDRLTSTGNPFSLVAADFVDISIKLDGTQMVLTNRVWGNTVTINNPTCDQGLIYGFGDPIAKNPDLALYVVSLQPELNPLL